MLALPLIGLLLSAAISKPTVDEFKGITFAPPANWQSVEQGSAKVLVPKDLMYGETIIVVLTGAVPANDDSPAKQFEALAKAANEGETIAANGEMASADHGKGKLVIQAFQMKGGDIGDHSRMLAMYLEGGQKTLLVIVIKPEALAEKYGDAINGLILSIKFKESKTGSTTGAVPGGKGKAPTGNTPNLFDGMPGWRPSGKGLTIPSPDLVNGKPQGMWWTPSFNSQNQMRPRTYIFLASGDQASGPRLGGGALWDREGQLKQNGHNGVGKFSIANGQITMTHDGFTSTDAYAIGADADGKFFKIRSAYHRPLKPATNQSISGTWRAFGSQYVFRADGTYEFGQVATGADFVASSSAKGKYSIDGYLLVLEPNGGEILISSLGAASKEMLAFNGAFFIRQK